MDDYEDMLFVGGHVDAHYYPVHTKQEVVSMREPFKAIPLVSTRAEPTSLVGKLHHYRRQRLIAGDTTYYVMVYEGLQGDVVGALINGYKREER